MALRASVQSLFNCNRLYGERTLIMIRKFRKRKISKDNQEDLTIMLKAICIDDGDDEIGESIIRNLERGKTEDVAVEVASFLAHKTAERFAEMVSGRRFSDIMQMIAGIQETDPVDAVRMLQMSFLERYGTDRLRRSISANSSKNCIR